MNRSHTTGLSVIVMLVGFGLSAARATAQTFNFSITYNTEFLFPPLDEDLEPEFIEVSPLIEEIPPEFQDAIPENLPPVLENPDIIDFGITGESISPNPPFGLTNFRSDTFGLSLPPQINPVTGQPTRQLSIFRGDPAALNVNLPTPAFSDIYFGDETDNRLFGLASDQAIFDFEAGMVFGGGVITIVGGESIFENATGRIEFTQEDELGPPGAPVTGEARLDFFVEVPQNVPEPSTNATLVGLGIIGAGVWLRRRTQQHF